MAQSKPEPCANKKINASLNRKISSKKKTWIRD
jgi:hypothetical protein